MYELHQGEATMPLSVRRAVVTDLSTIVEFNQRLAAESEGKTLDRALLTAGVAAALADPNKGPYFLAEIEGAPVGQMQVTYEWSDWRNGWFWWVQGVYVRPESRQQGVFKALYRHVETAARADPQVIGLRLYVERENRSAQETYGRLGMTWTNYLLMERYPL
jgi:GNAT superfamily N-acetyltransferase